MGRKAFVETEEERTERLREIARRSYHKRAEEVNQRRREKRSHDSGVKKISYDDYMLLLKLKQTNSFEDNSKNSNVSMIS